MTTRTAPLTLALILVANPNGKPVADRGKYLEVWKKVDGKWKCLSDTYNSDIPLP